MTKAFIRTVCVSPANNARVPEAQPKHIREVTKERYQATRWKLEMMRSSVKLRVYRYKVERRERDKKWYL